MLDRANKFFEFVEERERIRLQKEADLPFPWTEDPILQTYKFTNVRRHHDKTSRKLREMFYDRHFNDDPLTILMNCATFRYFGTWEFAEAIRWRDFQHMDEAWWEHVMETAAYRLEDGDRVFTGAYVITNQGISAPKYEVVVDHFLKPLQRSASHICEVAKETRSWEEVAKQMRPLKGFGGSGFMTKEILLDTTYTGFWGDAREMGDHWGNMSFPKDWYDWTPIGPGARRGASRVSGNDSARPLSEHAAADVIRQLCDLQDMFLDFKNVIGPYKLAPHDIQFQLCEFDKYERVRLGQGKPRSKYEVQK